LHRYGLYAYQGPPQGALIAAGAQQDEIYQTKCSSSFQIKKQKGKNKHSTLSFWHAFILIWDPSHNVFSL
jgi:hypothetical protein